MFRSSVVVKSPIQARKASRPEGDFVLVMKNRTTKGDK